MSFLRNVPARAGSVPDGKHVSMNCAAFGPCSAMAPKSADKFFKSTAARRGNAASCWLSHAASMLIREALTISRNSSAST